jgi:hypothetical protein
MEKNTDSQVPKKHTAAGGAGSKNGYLVALAAVIVAAGIFFLMSELKVLSPRQKTLESLMAAYQLYSGNDKKTEILLFFGDPESENFKTEKAHIYASEQTINQIKQALILLCSGPAGNKYLNLLPQGTVLREAYLDPNLVLYVDMSKEFSSNSKGGTTAEYHAVYSVLNTVFYNFRGIKGIKLLINGKEENTVSGHIKINDIMRPDTDFSDVKS